MSLPTDPSTDFGNGVYDSAKSTGENAINSFDPSSYGSAWKNGTTGLFNSQVGSGPSNATDFMSAYKNTIANNPTAQNLYTQGNSMFNVPTLQANANTLNNAVLQTPQNNLDAARGFNYDSSQISAKNALDLGRLSPLATAATNSANTASGLASNYVQAGLSQNATNLMPIQEYGSTLNDAMARQSTGFNTASEAELSALTAKMNAGVSLSTQEIARANALLSAQQSYNAAKLSNQNVVLKPGEGYLNTLTGEMNPYNGSISLGGGGGIGATGGGGINNQVSAATGQISGSPNSTYA